MSAPDGLLRAMEIGRDGCAGKTSSDFTGGDFYDRTGTETSEAGIVSAFLRIAKTLLPLPESP
ncbi:MAG: hypothetical protein BGO06_01935 [Shinella sp. 65-6]|nr:hypothetical protein [Hyphomicrobiales bacterium]OJU88936.1 MAG: hypothetical protein BGO06_01935 [Shinella sp. 65-6]